MIFNSEPLVENQKWCEIESYKERNLYYKIFFLAFYSLNGFLVFPIWAKCFGY